MRTLEISIRGNRFELHPCGAVYHINTSTVLVADVHFGKVTHFRKSGVAVPEESIMKNFRQLDRVLEHFEPRRLIFLGDLFHSDINSEWELFCQWMNGLQTEVHLVIGNHDIFPVAQYCDVEMKISHELEEGDFLFTHKPVEREGKFNFAGHIHPCIRLSGVGRQYLKLTCFYQTQTGMILPAFGHFTGTYEMTPANGDCIYAIANDEVVEISLTRTVR